LNPYADTSFLVSLYLSDGNSTQAIAAVQALDDALPVTDFHWLELQNALSLAVFQKRITEDQASQSWQDAQSDFDNGRLIPCLLNWQATFRLARDLAKTETPETGARSLDVLHVASALLIGASDFLTFDNRQRSLAINAGLKPG
jgi:predicted nucleic acid-binding protein